MLKTAALVTVALSLFIARPAAAESKSWAAVKGRINAKAAFVIGANLESIRATKTYSALLKMFLDDEEDAKQAFDMIKTTCAIDVPSAVSDVTAIMKADEKPLVVVGLNGLDEAKVVACLEKVGNQMASAAGAPGTVTIKLTAKKKGVVTEYSMAGESKKLYIAWLAPDVLAFTDDPNDKAKLTKMLAGKAAKGMIGTMIGKLSTSAAIWAAVVKKDTDPDIGTVLGGYGAVEISGPTVSVSGHVMMSKPAEAAAAVTVGMAGLGEMKNKVAKMPGMVKVLNTVKLAVDGKEVTFSASVADADIMGLIPQLDNMF